MSLSYISQSLEEFFHSGDMHDKSLDLMDEGLCDGQLLSPTNLFVSEPTSQPDGPDNCENSDEMSEEETLIDMLGFESYQDILCRIEEEIELETFQEDIPDHVLLDVNADVDCDAHQDVVLCPQCRGSALIFEFGHVACICGLQFNSTSCSTGRSLNAEKMKEVLAAVFDK